MGFIVGIDFDAFPLLKGTMESKIRNKVSKTTPWTDHRLGV